MVSSAQKAALVGLLVVSAAVGALLGAASSGGPAAPASSAQSPNEHGMSPDEACAHMPEHCEGGNASGG